MMIVWKVSTLLPLLPGSSSDPEPLPLTRELVKNGGTRVVELLLIRLLLLVRSGSAARVLLLLPFRRYSRKPDDGDDELAKMAAAVACAATAAETTVISAAAGAIKFDNSGSTVESIHKDWVNRIRGPDAAPFPFCSRGYAPSIGPNRDPIRNNFIRLCSRDSYDDMISLP